MKHEEDEVLLHDNFIWWTLSWVLANCVTKKKHIKTSGFVMDICVSIVLFW